MPARFCLATPGLDANDHVGLSISTGKRSGISILGAAHAAAWASIIEEAMNSLAHGLQILMDAGLPPPDEVGYELEQNGEVVAEAELGWLQRKLVLLMPEHADSASVWELNGWTVLVAMDDWQLRLTEELGNSTVEQDLH